MKEIKQYLIDFQKRKFETFEKYNQEEKIKENKYKIQVIPLWKWLLS